MAPPPGQARLSRIDQDHAEQIERLNAAIGGLQNGHETLVQQMMDIILSHERMNDRLDKTDAQIGSIREELSKNTEVTTEVRDYLQAFKGGFKVLGWFGTALKWTAGVAAAAAALWTAWKTITGGAPLK